MLAYLSAWPFTISVLDLVIAKNLDLKPFATSKVTLGLLSNLAIVLKTFCASGSKSANAFVFSINFFASSMVDLKLTAMGLVSVPAVLPKASLTGSLASSSTLAYFDFAVALK